MLQADTLTRLLTHSLTAKSDAKTVSEYDPIFEMN